MITGSTASRSTAFGTGAATLLLAAGVSDTVAMRTMGHADTRILARYQDVVSELQRDAATRMDDLLGGGTLDERLPSWLDGPGADPSMVP